MTTELVARYDAVLEGRGLTFYIFRGRVCVIATMLGRVLGYGDDGGDLPDVIRKAWSSELVEGRDVAVLRGQDLYELKAILSQADLRSVSRSRHLTVLYEAGYDLVCKRDGTQDEFFVGGPLTTERSN